MTSKNPLFGDSPVNKIVDALGDKLREEGYTRENNLSGSLSIAGHNVAAIFYIGLGNKLAAKLEGKTHTGTDEMGLLAESSQRASAFVKPVSAEKLDEFLDVAIEQVIGQKQQRSALDMARRTSPEGQRGGSTGMSSL